MFFSKQQLRNTNSYAVGPNGSVYKCLEHLGDKSKRIGSLLERISLYKKAGYSFVKNPFEDEKCVNCNVFPICGGRCPLDRMRDNGNKEKNVCSFYKKHMPKIMRMTYSEMKSKG